MNIRTRQISGIDSAFTLALNSWLQSYNANWFCGFEQAEAYSEMSSQNTVTWTDPDSGDIRSATYTETIRRYKLAPWHLRTRVTYPAVNSGAYAMLYDYPSSVPDWARLPDSTDRTISQDFKLTSDDNDTCALLEVYDASDSTYKAIALINSRGDFAIQLNESNKYAYFDHANPYPVSPDYSQPAIIEESALITQSSINITVKSVSVGDMGILSVQEGYGGAIGHGGNGDNKNKTFASLLSFDDGFIPPRSSRVCMRLS